jgi:hypothetical protein
MRRSSSGWSSNAPSAATWATVEAAMNRFCARRSTAGTSSSGSTSQPRRQPVMQKYFEKLLATIASGAIPSAVPGRSS